jgi:hypothetical protein
MRAVFAQFAATSFRPSIFGVHGLTVGARRASDFESFAWIGFPLLLLQDPSGFAMNGVNMGP